MTSPLTSVSRNRRPREFVEGPFVVDSQPAKPRGVRQLGCVVQQFADPGRRLNMLSKLELGPRHRKRGLAAGHPGQSLTLPDRVGPSLIMLLDQEWFVDERFKL